MPDGVNRKTTERLTLRFTPEEMAEFQAAFEAHPEKYLGKSYFMRRAVMNWARGANSQIRARELSARFEKKAAAP